MGNRIINAKANIISGIVSKLVFIILPFITRTCIIYCLGTMYLGLNSLFTSILQLLSLAELGFGEALVFSMYKPLAENDNSKVCALLNLYRRIYRIIGTIILIIGICFLPFLDKIIKGDIPNEVNIHILYIIYLLNTVLSYWLFAYKNSILSASQKLSISNNINTLVQVSLSIIQIILILLFNNYYLFVIVIPIFTIIKNLIINKITKKMYPMFFCFGNVENEEYKEIKKRVAGLFIYKICGSFRTSFNSIIISAFIGLTILAKYENYSFIVNSIIGIMTLISSGIVAGVGNSIVSETVEKNYNDYIKFFFTYELLTTWCTVCLVCLTQPFMKLWVGENLMMSNSILILFCAYFYILKTCDICYVYRQAAGIWWKDKYRPIIEAILNLTLSLILIKKIGIEGILISTIITMSFINFFWAGHILFKSYFKRSMIEYIKHSLLYLFNTIIVVIITYVLCNTITDNGYLSFILKIMICIVVPSILLIVIYSKNKEFNSFKMLVKEIIKK